MANLLNKKVDEILQSYGIDVEGIDVQKIFGDEEPTFQQIYEFKKVLAASIVTANDKGMDVPNPHQRDYNKPEDVASTANETIGCWSILWQYAKGYLQDHEDVLDAIIDNICVQIISNLEWIVGNGIELTIEALETTTYMLDIYFPGAGEYLRTAIDLIRTKRQTIVEFIVEKLPQYIDNVRELIKETIHETLETPYTGPVIYA